MFLNYDLELMKAFNGIATPATYTADVVSREDLAPDALTIKENKNTIQKDSFARKRQRLYVTDRTVEITINLSPDNYSVIDLFSFGGGREKDVDGVTTDAITLYDDLMAKSLPLLLKARVPGIKHRLYLKVTPRSGNNDLNMTSTKTFEQSVILDAYGLEYNGDDITYIEDADLQKVLTKFKAIQTATGLNFFGGVPTP